MRGTFSPGQRETWDLLIAAYRARAGAVLETVRSALIYPAVLVGFGIFAMNSIMGSSWPPAGGWQEHSKRAVLGGGRVGHCHGAS